MKSSILPGSDANSNDTLTYSVVSQGAKGTVVITNAATGAFTYTPNNNVLGSDSFTFKINDGIIDSNTATVTVTIYDPNIAPVASAITPAAFNEDTQSGVITLSYTDADADLATACTISNLSNVTVSQACACDGAGVCTLKVTGTANYSGAASFDYAVTANGQDSNVATANLSISFVNDTPTITAIAAQSTNEDVDKAIAFTINDVDTTLTCGASVSMSSTNTTLVPNTNVVWSGTAPTCTGTVTPAADGYGTSDLTFTVTDGALTATTTFTLTVNRLGDDAFDGTVAGDYWSFDFLSDALYSFTNTVIRLTGGVAELIGTVQTDSSATETTDGTFTAGTKSGVVVGTLTDGVTTGLKLGNSGSCNGGASDCAKQDAAEIYELSSSWTPQWGSIVGYWKLNGDIGGVANGATVSSSQGSSNGTMTGSGTSYVSGKILQGIQFNATDYVSIPQSSSANVCSNITVSMWLKWDAPNTNSNGGLAGNWRGCNTDAGWFIAQGGTTKKIRMSFATTAVFNQAISTSSSPLDRNWHNFTFTLNSSGNLNLYVDGSRDTGTTISIGAGVCSPIAPIKISKADCCGGINGAIVDETAIWNTVLTADEIRAIYDRQKSAYSGTFTSRIMDAKSSSSWTTLSWVPTLPFYKELPDSTCTPTPCTHNNPEGSANYTSLVGSTGVTSDATISTSGLVGLWHMNEGSWADVAGEVRDDSGNGNHGRGKNGATTGSGGILGFGGIFDGTNDYIDLGATTPAIFPMGASARTISVWSNLRNVTASAFIQYGTAGANTLNLFYINGGTVRVAFFSNDYNTGIAPTLNVWQHWVMTYDGVTTLKVFLNGTAVYTNTTITPPNTTSGSANRIGNYGGSYASGYLDELAIWNRALHANEIKQLFQRGASRIKYQVRTCNDNACSGETWQGPDGTSGTYFSELNNNTTPITGLGDVKATLPSMLFSNFTSPPSTNQYFQYRTIFESDSTTAALWPELKSTTVDPIHYPTYLSTDTTPGNTIIGQNSVAFYELNSFTQTLGAGGCSGGVVFNLGLSNMGPWKYWNGSAWVAANGSSAQANTAAALVASSNAALTAFATDVGRGSVFFKAFLTSDGTSKCELDNIQVGGNR